MTNQRENEIAAEAERRAGLTRRGRFLEALRRFGTFALAAALVPALALAAIFRRRG